MEIIFLCKKAFSCNLYLRVILLLIILPLSIYAKTKDINETILVDQREQVIREMLPVNIVKGVNVLTQSMLNQSNTIYVIQNDYDLGGAHIIIPSGCILDFEGGSLYNGSVDFNYCLVSGFPKMRIGLSNIGNSEVHTSWFLGQSDDFGAWANSIMKNNISIIVDSPLNSNTRIDINGYHDVVFDFNGNTMIDDLNHQVDAAGRVIDHYIHIRNSYNIKIQNLDYKVGKKVFAGIGTIIGVGGLYSDNINTTHDIKLENISATTNIGNYIFIGVLGEAFNISIDGLKYDGSLGYLTNIEYGLSPMDNRGPNGYGRHPHNIEIRNVEIQNNTNKNAYLLRTSSCYNVKFVNCCAYNSNGVFIMAYSGDDSIYRFRGGITYENCVGSGCGVSIKNALVNPNKRTNKRPSDFTLDFSYRFVNCEVGKFKTTGASGFRIENCNAAITLESCKISGATYGVNITDVNKYLDKIKTITLRNCYFLDNATDIVVGQYAQLDVEKCIFHKKYIGRTSILFLNKGDNVAFHPFFNIEDCIFDSAISDVRSFIDTRMNADNSYRYYSIVKDCVFKGNTRNAIVSNFSIKREHCFGNNVYADENDYGGIIPKSIDGVTVLDYQKNKIYMAPADAKRDMTYVIEGCVKNDSDYEYVLYIQKGSKTTSVIIKHNLVVDGAWRIMCPLGKDMKIDGPAKITFVRTNLEGYDCYIPFVNQ